MYVMIEEKKQFYDYRDEKENVCFVVDLRNDNMDIQILFDYYMVMRESYFLLVIIPDTDKRKGGEIESKVRVYGALFNGEHEYYIRRRDFLPETSFAMDEICSIEEKMKRIGASLIIDGPAVRYIGRLFPLIRIEKTSHCILSKIVDEEWLDELMKSNQYYKEKKDMREVIRAAKKNNSLEDFFREVIVRLINHPIGSEPAQKLRAEILEHKNCYDLFLGRNVLSVLLFALIDLSVRTKSIEKYKQYFHEINSLLPPKERKAFRGSENDFLQEEEFAQPKTNFLAYCELMDSSPEYDVKSFYLDYKQRIIHPLYSLEMTEACSLSEGILQLTDNIVKHAGAMGTDTGKGCLSIYLRDVHKSEAILEQYHDVYEHVFNENVGYECNEFRDVTRKKNKGTFCLEIIICDKSDESIPNRFIKNNNDFFGAYPGASELLKLRDFFVPSNQAKQVFDEYYKKDDNAVKHYGLPVFNSIVSARRGHFEVHSKGEQFPEGGITEKSKKWTYKDGTRYLMFIPLYLYSLKEERELAGNTYAFDYSLNPIEFKRITPRENEDLSIVIESMKNKLSICGRDSNIDAYCFDYSEVHDVETLTKGILTYLNRWYDRNRDKDRKLYLVLLSGKKYDIVEIVRYFVLYFYKQDFRENLGKIQVYIKGKNCHEEVVLCGENFESVRRNIFKCMFVNGIVFDDIVSCFELMNPKGSERI